MPAKSRKIRNDRKKSSSRRQYGSTIHKSTRYSFKKSYSLPTNVFVDKSGDLMIAILDQNVNEVKTVPWSHSGWFNPNESGNGSVPRSADHIAKYGKDTKPLGSIKNPSGRSPREEIYPDYDAVHPSKSRFHPYWYPNHPDYKRSRRLYKDEEMNDIAFMMRGYLKGDELLEFENRKSMGFEDYRSQAMEYDHRVVDRLAQEARLVDGFPKRVFKDPGRVAREAKALKDEEAAMIAELQVPELQRQFDINYVFPEDDKEPIPYDYFKGLWEDDDKVYDISRK